MTFIVVPAYNEEKKIGRVIRDLFNHGFKNLVVVDDGSIDSTISEVKKTEAKLLRHLVNRGQGAALQTGDDYCIKNNADLVVHFDADGQFLAKDIVGAIEFMKSKNVDVLLGSRFLDNRSSTPFLKKYIILPVSRWINLMFTGVKLTDAHNGFRILNKKSLEKIQIIQDGMAHNSEIISQIKKYQLTFVEYPVEVIYHEYGQGIGGGFKILRDLVVGRFLE